MESFPEARIDSQSWLLSEPLGLVFGLINPKVYSRTDVSAIVENEGVEPDIGGTGAG